jgi:hypothetical protein|nr:hypothetical protein [uncultured Acetatifactor sp.]
MENANNSILIFGCTLYIISKTAESKFCELLGEARYPDSEREECMLSAERVGYLYGRKMFQRGK